MKEKDNRVFREKTLEKLSSPDNMMDYLRVTGPGIWLILIGILVLLAGLFVWGIFGSISTTVTVPAEAENGEVRCYILQEDMEDTSAVIGVQIGDQKMQASADSAQTKTMGTSDDPELYESGYLTAGKNVTVLTCPTSLEDGFYQAELTTETMHPISLLFEKT